MTRRRPLPDPYETSPFSRAQAQDSGLPHSRLRAADLESFGRGLYRSIEGSRVTWNDLGLVEPSPGLDPSSLSALIAVTGGTLSHQTAAFLYGIPLPPWLADSADIHITGPEQLLRSRRPGVRGHRRPLAGADIGKVLGLACTTPERTWLDLASLLRPGQEAHAVVAGDHLVKRPWADGVRLEPWTTPDRLASALARVGRFKGVRRARAALPLVRVGADSPTETLVRLRLVDAGLSEPELQVHATEPGGDPYPADLGYRDWKIALQYDGEHHAHPAQQAIDARRDAWFHRHGWLVIRITAEDLRDDLRSVVRQIRDHVAHVRGPIKDFAGSLD